MQKNRFFYLHLIFWIGLSSLIYEIYSTKVLFLFFLETNHAVTIAISAFLAGLAFSSLFFSSIFKNKTKYSLLIIWWMQMAVAFYGFFILRHYDLIPQAFDFVRQNVALEGLSNFIKITLIWIYLFIPAFFIGGSFPLINGLYLESKEKGTRDTGMVYFWDTFGSILGSFIAGFWLLPQYGFRLTATLVVLLNLIIAFIISPKKEFRAASLIFIIFILANEYLYFQKNTLEQKTPPILASISATSSDQMIAYPAPSLNPVDLKKVIENQNDKNTFFKEFPNLEKQMFGDILFQEISPFGKITIGSNAFGEKDDKTLFINYRDMCHSASHGSESQIGNLAVSQLPQNSRALNIGFGCGFTANAIAKQSNISHLDIAEINPIVIKGAKVFFKEENGDVLNSAKTTLYIEDGAEFIRNTSDKYDAIIIDIEEVSIIYSSPLYTQEYFNIAHNILNLGGVFALWAHRGSNDFEKIIYNTLKSVFPYVEIRVLDGFYTFYASDSKLNLPEVSPATQQMANSVLKDPLDKINTLDNRILEKYFNTQSYFNLPVDYKEEFLR